MRRYTLSIVPLFIFSCLLCIGAPALAVHTNICEFIHQHYPIGTPVEIDSVVVTAVDLKPTTYGIWVQDLNAYCGIRVYTGAVVPTVRIGDLVNVSGEYCGEREICYPIIVKIGSAPPPAPALLSTGDLGYAASDSAKAEKWKGVFIKVDTVVCVDISMGYGQWAVVEAHAHGSVIDTIWIGPKMLDPTPAVPAVGDTFAYIQGIWWWEYGNYKLWPRIPPDIVPLGCPPAPNLVLAHSISETGIYAYFDAAYDSSALDITKYYLEDSSGAVIPICDAYFVDPQSTLVCLITCVAMSPCVPETLCAWSIRNREGCAESPRQCCTFRGGICPISVIQTPKSATNDSSLLDGQQVTLRGIVTADPTQFYGEFFVEERQAGPWSGIAIYGSLIHPTVGDSATVSGLVSEYCNKTEIIAVDYVRIHSSGNRVPGPDVVSICDLTTGPPAESWEGVFVKVNNAIVDSTDNGGWYICDPIWRCCILVGRDHYCRFYFCPTCTTYAPIAGMWMNVQGIADYRYGQRAIRPRTCADIIYPVGASELETGQKTLEFGLFQNVPNPFSPRTEIRYAVPEDSRVDLRIYDVAGKMVRALLKSERVRAGVHAEVWDGRNNSGQELASGVYFYQLRAGDKVATMKMVLLR
ncbi:MAG: FlgD immunoglobulin-like domain containing protein [Candidatus Eisenbacteria bacterium]|nr:FlgD immunoglobulin-like domain containing protein [Candidatus Eisenbacteria bacterium]